MVPTKRPSFNLAVIMCLSNKSSGLILSNKDYYSKEWHQVINKI